MQILVYNSCEAKTLKQLREVHGQVTRQSLHHHNHHISLLIRRCAALRAPLPYVRLLFHSLPNPDLLLFTTALKYFSLFAARPDILSLFRRLLFRRPRQNLTFLYPIVINASANASEVASAHAHVFKLGYHCDAFVRNAVVNGYLRFGLLGLAREMFDEMPERGAADWNAMISGYWRRGRGGEACDLFDEMPERERNVVSWTAMVTGFARSGDLERARSLFDEMPERSVVSWNAMLSGYAQNGLVDEAIELFLEMVDVGVEADETTWVTVISSLAERGDPRLAKSLVESLDSRRVNCNCFVKTALIDMYAKCGELSTARRIFDEMGTHANVVSWNAMISAYARVGDLASARCLFDKMPRKNVVSWNSMIAGYAQNGHSSLAIELFKEMTVTNNFKPDEVTMVSVISACGHLGAYELGKWVMDVVAKNRINLSISGYNSLISMYSRCGSMEDAERIFHDISGVRDVVSYNSLITGFAAHGYGTRAIELMSNMKEEGLEPDRITFIGVLTACSHAGLLEEGQHVFRSIKSPTVDHYACMVDLLGRGGKLEEAKRLIDGMPMKAHAGVYGALLNASHIHKQLELGEFAAYKLFDLEPENSGNYVLLSNIYAFAKRWKEVDRIRELMGTRGVKKTTGCSWVEFDGKVHRFIAGDQLHECSKEIYHVLEELEKRMRAVGYIAIKDCVLRDVEDEEKEVIVGTHSEKLAIGFALLRSEEGAVIRVVKNLRVCGDCHVAIKMISKLTSREILVRDNNRFHRFKDGECSCQDYW
ncbi:hypothetical protein Scep_010712 [Stephania cephalantha]|uniref:DYW domain-containing protein n=1 Tax=Stephania cephalantha TaxID=152367 RepID=A0AAP0JVW8_9MAGN